VEEAASEDKTGPQGANLSRANLLWADLTDADLLWTLLRGANLGAANLNGADLREADLSRANLTGANLGGTKLRGANLRSAKLGKTEFGGAALGGTVFAAVDLSTAKGLETVRHDGPSTVGVDTIYNSQGKIPEAFLRGAGLPDEFIAYIGSLVGRPIQFYSCFISYSGKDQKFADRLYEGLQNKGVRCWFAPHDIQGGRKIYEQIDEAIRLHDKLLLILSEHSMNSEWVKTEIFNAREREVAGTGSSGY
jgi:TIR domain/Pentapeptide repeats (8 copies)